MKSCVPPVCYPADHHQVHDEVGNSVPVAHHDGVRCSQIRFPLNNRKRNILHVQHSLLQCCDGRTDRWTYCLLVELHEAGDDAVILQSTHQVNDAGEGELSKNCVGENAHEER